MQKHCYELTKWLKQRVKVHTLIQTPGTIKVVFLLSAVTRALKIIKKNPNISVIYVNDGLMAFVLTRIIGKVNIPLVVTLHGLDVVFPMQFYQRWFRKNINRYKAVIAVSDATKKECLKRGLEPDKIFMIKNGFEMPSNHPNLPLDSIEKKIKHEHGLDVQGKKIILSVGRGVKRKGFSWFIENVFPRLPKDIYYLIVSPVANTWFMKGLKALLSDKLFQNLALFSGLPTDELAIEKACKASHGSNRIYRISRVSNDEVKALMRLAHVLVMPNVSVEGDFEGFGLVALEATAQGTICAASAIEGITTALEQGKNGILLPCEDADSWNDTLSNLLQEQEEKYQEKIKLYQQNTIHNSFSWERMSEEYYKVFTQVSL